jgi:hypothetical protein
MERLSNSVSAAIQMWKPINFRNPDDGDDTISETSARVSTTRYNVLEDNFNKGIVRLVVLYAVRVFIKESRSCKVECRRLLGWFHGGTSYRCLMVLCTLWLLLEPTFRRNSPPSSG